MLRNKPVIGPIGAAVACAVLFGMPSAFGSDAAEVEELIQQALNLRRQQKDPLAYPLLQKAHELGSTPRTAAQLGLVEINLGYWLDAERHLSESLAARKNVWVHQHRDVLEQNLEKARRAIGEVLVVGTPAGAEVQVNGKVVGDLPMQAPVRLGEGPAKVEIRASGFAPSTRSVQVIGGQRQEISFALQPVKPTAPPATPPPVSGTIPQVGTPAHEGSDAGPDRIGATPWMRPLAWTAAALAAGSLVFAAAQTKTWLDKREAFDNHLPSMPAMLPATPDCGAKDPNRGGPGCEAIYSSMERARTRAIATYAAGTLLAAGSVTLFILSNRGQEETRLACAPTLGINGAGCRLTF